jgi:hypothetical protein
MQSERLRWRSASPAPRIAITRDSRGRSASSKTCGIDSIEIVGVKSLAARDCEQFA